MAGSSPSDLAVAFRSFPRRMREALALAEDDPSRVAAARAGARALEQAVADAATVVGAPVGSDLATTSTSVAERIESIEPDEWDAATLDRLRTVALDGGRILRDVESAARG